jgi:cobyric acid synthase
MIPKGYTKDYVDGKITKNQQRQLVHEAYQQIAAVSDVVLCEGTGHVAVGSIVDASNAEVASWLGERMVLGVNGGLGNAFDELDLKKVFCDEYGVEIAGVSHAG